MPTISGHLRHHGRFYAAALLGAAVYAGMSFAHASLATAAAGDTFFAVYLMASAWLVLKSAKADEKLSASMEDEGIMVVVVIALAAVSFNIAGIFILLNQAHRPDLLPLAVALAGAPLGWCMLHMISAFHYAKLYYASATETSQKALDFPGSEEPNLWDFVYFSFVIGMTAQVADVQICNSAMRRAVIGHSIVSFFYNTVLIAMVVNVVVASVG